MICGNCGKEFDGDVCPMCGAQARNGAGVCPVCGQQKITGSKFCYKCGCQFDEQVQGSENKAKLVASDIGRSPLGRLVASGVDEVRGDQSSVSSVLFKVFRSIIGSCMLCIGVVGLILLSLPMIYYAESLNASGNLHLEPLRNGIDLFRGSILTKTFDYACWGYVVVTIFCLIYGLVLQSTAIKSPHKLFRNPATWIIDMVVAVAYLAIYCVAENELKSSFMLKSGGILVGALVFSIIVLCVLVARIIYEVRIYKLKYAGLSEEDIAKKNSPDCKGKLTKKLIIVGVVFCVVAIAAAAIIVPIVDNVTNILSIDRVERFSVGNTKSMVVNELGDPYISEETYFEYFSDDYIKVLEQIKAAGEDSDKLDELYAKLDEMTYKYIRVDFDERGGVVAALFDNNRNNKQNVKEVESYELLTNDVLRYNKTDIYYSAKYVDGSYYMGAAIKDYMSLFEMNFHIEWEDDFGNAYEDTIFVKTNNKGGLVIDGDVVVPYGVTSIDDVFQGTSITSVTIPSSVTSINAEAFENCSNLQRVIFESGSALIEIGENAFLSCSNLTEIELPSSVTYIGDYAFSKSGLRSIVVPKSVASLGEYAFSGCAGLESVIIEDGSPLESLSIALFSKCEQLKSVKFPADSKLTEIEDYAFENCKLLAEIDIPSSVKVIGENAFAFCFGLENLTFESECRLIGIGSSAFIGSGLKEVNIPSSVESIGDLAFADCGRLESVTFESGSKLTEICGDVFRYSGLKEIVIPSSVESIGNSAFRGSDKLERVTFENESKLKSIESNAFRDCKALTEIVIPYEVASIGQQVFYGCENLTSVTFENTSGWSRKYQNNSSVSYIDVTDPLQNAIKLNTSDSSYLTREAAE